MIFFFGNNFLNDFIKGKWYIKRKPSHEPLTNWFDWLVNTLTIMFSTIIGIKALSLFTKAVLRQHRDQFRMFFLPLYSIECLLKVFARRHILWRCLLTSYSMSICYKTPTNFYKSVFWQSYTKNWKSHLDV